MLLATTSSVAGHEIEETLGVVYGAVTRSTGAHRGLIAWIKSWLGGELEEYTKVLAEAREQALDRLREHARSLGADAVVSVRFTSVEVATSAAEVIAYGTAVKLRKPAAESDLPGAGASVPGGAGS